jgi:hypothetical protein
VSLGAASKRCTSLLTVFAQQNYTPPNATASEYQSIPLNKIEDFGVHANAYYPLEISHFKSTNDAKLLDLLWNKYWVTTLSQSPLVSVRFPSRPPKAELTCPQTEPRLHDLPNRRSR